MSELTDDQLDGLFRKSAEEFEPPFDPAAWQDMKARLDATDHTKPGGAALLKNLLRWGLPLLLLLLLTGGGWYAYKNKTTAKKTDQPETSRLAGADPQVEQSVDLRKSTGNDGSPQADRDRTGLAGNRTDLESRDITSTERSPETARARTVTEKTADAKMERATKSTLPAYKSVTGRNRGSRTQRVIAVGGIVGRETEGEESPTRKPVAFVENRSARQRRGTRRNGVSFSATGYAITTAPSFNRRRKTTERNGNQPMITTLTDEAVQRKTVQSGTVQPGVVQAEVGNEPSASAINVSELAIRPAKWSQLSFTNRPVQFQPDRTEQPVVTRPVVQRGLSIRVAVAPDLSGVGLKNFSRPGTNIGAFLEYRFAPRWSVQAGLIQSTKVYRASSGDYTYTYGDWGGPVMPLSIDGRCNMFDIPINIRYDIMLKPQNDKSLVSRWFVSGGVTSYIMNNEDYTYNYPPHTYQPTEKNASTGGYGFSNLNLSVGYERALSRRLSWQVEPFMKVPLKGVGYFKVDLLSTGAFFSLRYKL